MSKYHYEGHMIKQDWLDRLTLTEIQNATKKEKLNSKFLFMTLEFAQIKCEDVKYKVLYYEEVRSFSSLNWLFVHFWALVLTTNDQIFESYLSNRNHLRMLIESFKRYQLTSCLLLTILSLI